MRKPAPEVDDDAVIQVAKSLRLVSKTIGEHLDFPSRHYLVLARTDFPTVCRHHQPETFKEGDPVVLPVDYVPSPLWCDSCKHLERFEQMYRAVDLELTFNNETLERMFSLAQVWKTPLVSKYFSITPGVAKVLNEEYMRDNTGSSAIYLTAVESLQEFLRRAKCGFSAGNKHRFWRYCEKFNHLDMITDPREAASDDIHTANSEIYAHKVLDIGQTHYPSTRDWLNMHAPAPHMRHHVSVCCSDRHFDGFSEDVKVVPAYLPDNESWRDPICSQLLDVDGTAMWDLRTLCPVTWRDDTDEDDRGVANDMAAAASIQDSHDV